MKVISFRLEFRANQMRDTKSPETDARGYGSIAAFKDGCAKGEKR